MTSWKEQQTLFFFTILIQEVYVESLNGFRFTFWQLSVKMLPKFIIITPKLFGDGILWWEYWQYFKLQGNALVMGGSCSSCGRSVLALWLADWKKGLMIDNQSTINNPTWEYGGPLYFLGSRRHFFTLTFYWSVKCLQYRNVWESMGIS